MIRTAAAPTPRPCQLLLVASAWRRLGALSRLSASGPANAAAVSVVLLTISFVTLFVLRLWGSRAQRREERSS